MRYPELLRLNVVPMEHTAEHHVLGRGDQTLAFFVILNSVNFGSGYFPYLEKANGLSGYFTIARRLKEHIETNGLPSPQSLSTLTPAACAEIFGQSLQNPHAAELMELFAAALRQLGTWATNEHAGDYLGVLRRATRAEAVVDSLLRMPFYRDVATYVDIHVPLLKRAQILLQDLTLADPGNPLLQFPDIDSLTIFADNVLPYVLRADGVLQYHSWLAARIDEQQPIGAGSLEEIEIRACTVHAVEVLHKVVCDELIEVPVRQLDFCLWNRGQELKRLIGDKRHRTRTVYY
jgi:hypothetical protein